MYGKKQQRLIIQSALENCSKQKKFAFKKYELRPLESLLQVACFYIEKSCNITKMLNDN